MEAAGESSGLSGGENNSRLIKVIETPGILSKSTKSSAGLLHAATSPPQPQRSGSTDLTRCVAELKSHRLAIDGHDSLGEKGDRGGKTGGEANFARFPSRK